MIRVLKQPILIKGLCYYDHRWYNNLILICSKKFKLKVMITKEIQDKVNSWDMSMVVALRCAPLILTFDPCVVYKPHQKLFYLKLL